MTKAKIAWLPQEHQRVDLHVYVAGQSSSPKCKHSIKNVEYVEIQRECFLLFSKGKTQKCISMCRGFHTLFLTLYMVANISSAGDGGRRAGLRCGMKRCAFHAPLFAFMAFQASVDLAILGTGISPNPDHVVLGTIAPGIVQWTLVWNAWRPSITENQSWFCALLYSQLSPEWCSVLE